MNTVKILFAALALSLATTTQAIVLLGTVDPASPANVVDEVHYVNTLIKVVEGDLIPDPYSETYGNVNNPKTRIYDAMTTAPSGTYDDVNDTDTAGDPDWDQAITVSGWDYALAKYGNVAVIWFLDGAQFTIPELGADTGAGIGNSISHYQLFTAHQTNVPDGGATVALLGLGTLALAVARRKA